MSRIHRNILCCYALSFTWGFLLLQGIMVPFFLSRNMTMIQIFITQTVFIVTLGLLDMPTGYISDIIGRRATLIIAGIFKGLGGTALAMADGFSGVVIAYVLIGAANSFLSGADVALLYESYEEEETGSSEQRPSIAQLRGRTIFIGSLSVTLAVLLGGVLSARSLTITAWVNAAFAWLSLVVVFFVREPKVRRMSRRDHYRNLKEIYHRLFTQDKTLRRVILLSVLYSLAPTLALYTFQRRWEELGIPLVYFGAIAAAQNIFSGLSGIYANPIHKRIGRSLTIAIIGSLPIIAFLGASLKWVIVAVASSLILESLRVLIQVTLVDDMNSRVTHEHRATANSLISFCNRLLASVGAPLMGKLVQSRGAHEAFRVVFWIYLGLFLVTCLPLVLRKGTEDAQAPPAS